MHIILKNYLNDLSDVFSWDEKKISDSKKFEFLCNYCVISKHFLGRFDPQDVTTEEDDASIDGIAIIIDGELITTNEDATKIFEGHKTNLQVDLIFVQAKSGEKFSKEEISNYKIGLDDFLSLDPKLPNGSLNKEALAVFNVILNNLKKIKDKRPSAYFYYCTSGTYRAESEIKATFEIMERSIRETDLFHDVYVFPIGRAEIIKLYKNISEVNQANLLLIDYLSIPPMNGIPQSYIGVVNAKDFVLNLLVDEDGKIKQGVFEENIRAFLGEENDVNTKIADTIQNEEKKKIFSILNNGITIVSPELTLTANLKKIELSNYQIINGCQTSSTLYNNLNHLDDKVNVVIKFIQSLDSGVSSDIIEATNSQSNISQEAFHVLKAKANLVQQYFNAQNGVMAPENKIYFERRENEYKTNNYQKTRIFDLRELSRCFAAMFLNQPANSARYVKAIFSVSGDNLFKDDHHESLYYCSALALYKYQTLINGQKINAHNYVKLRWHIIYLLRFMIHERMEDIQLNSNKVESYTKKIIDVLTTKEKAYLNRFQMCHDVIDVVGIPNDDILKTTKYFNELKKAARDYLQARSEKLKEKKNNKEL